MDKYLFFNFKNRPSSLKQWNKLIEIYAQYGQFLQNLKEKRAPSLKIVLFPPFIYLLEAKKQLKTAYLLGAQDMFWLNKINITGEITPLMLKSIGVSYVLLGHFERREYLAETNSIINLKMKACFSHKLIPVLCVGEKIKPLQTQTSIDFRTKKEIFDQLNLAFREIALNQISTLVIAYEPFWAIGQEEGGNFARVEEIGQLIRFWLARRFSEEIAKEAIILYGGAVKATNIQNYLNLKSFNGVLLGRASSDLTELKKVFQNLFPQAKIHSKSNNNK